MIDSEGKSASTNLYSVYQHNAKNRGFTFELSKENFLVLTKQDCYYCGSPPNRIHKNYNNGSIYYYTYNGVDRVDNTVGYQLDNCVPCCRFCNIAKGTLTPEEFIDKVIKIYLYQT